MTTDSTIEFYNKESEQYSKKRYEGKTETYHQFLFKRRRQLFLGLISSISKELNNIDALDIGCADGVIVKKLLQKLPEGFNSVTGIDISPNMIQEAKKSTKNPKAKYFLRGEEPQQFYNLVIEMGVYAPLFEDEMVYVSKKLHSMGYFIYSAAGISSIHAKIKLKDKEYLKDYFDYTGYEKIIEKYFEIISSEVYGLFIPKLWAFPIFARVVQPLLETITKKFFPNLFHEKIYLLRKKN